MGLLREIKLISQAVLLTLWDQQADLIAALGVPRIKTNVHTSVAPLARRSRWIVPAAIMATQKPLEGSTWGTFTPARSWAKYTIPKGLPEPGQRVLAIENDPHTLEGFSGEIEEGYGKGTKLLLYRDQVIVKVGGKTFPGLAEYHFHDADRAGPHWDLAVEGVKPGTRRFEINVPRGDQYGRYAFNQTQRGLLVVRMQDQGLRLDRNRYQLKPEAKLADYDPKEWVMERKWDGSWASAALAKDRAAFHSHREGGETYYDRLPSIEWVNNRSPFLLCRTLFPGPMLDGTVFKGEITHPDGAPRVSGILNSMPDKARQIQVLRGPVDFHVWDIARYKGRDVSDLPYEQRRELYLRLVGEIRRYNKHWHAVDAAPDDFQEFYDRVTSDPLPSGEGVVLKRRDQAADAAWPKIKRRDFAYFDLVDVLEGNGKYAQSVGAMVVRNPSNDAVGEVGSFAVTDENRDWIWRHRNDVKGATVKVLVQDVTERGVPRAGVFVGFHDQAKGVHPNLKMYAESVAGGDPKRSAEVEYAVKTSAGWRRK